MTDNNDCPPCEKAKKEAVHHICKVRGPDGAPACEAELLEILNSIPQIGPERAKELFKEKVREIHEVNE